MENIFIPIAGDTDTGDGIIIGAAAVTILNHVLMGCRMLIYQKKITAHVQQQQQQQHLIQMPQPPHDAPANSQQHQVTIVSSSLVDHKITARTIGLSCVLGPFLILHTYFLAGFSAMLRFALVCVVLLFLPMSMYIGKRHLRITLWREVKSMWQ